MDNFLHGTSHLSLDEMQTMKIARKKPLFNGKVLAVKKLKEVLPDELITRKLVWEGKETKKVDHNSIYKDILEKIKT